MSIPGFSEDQNFKQAVENTREYGHACYDVYDPQGHGHFTLVKDSDGLYDLEGQVEGVSVHASADEFDMPVLLEELNINPHKGWYSL